MPKAIQIQKPGGPEEIKLVDVPVGEPGPGEVRIRHHACGVNFIDVYQRTGLYPFPMPLVLGNEGAGVIEAVGPGVTHLKVGDRAAYGTGGPGAYSEVRVMKAMGVCKLPESIGFDTAAAMMLKGMTVQYLLKRTQPQGGLQNGDFIVWHAAAGGVGLIACQWAKALGFQLIGTAGSDEKCQLAKENGAAHVINYKKENFVERVKQITGGKGVKVVSFGNSSGPVPPFAPAILGQKGSLYVTRCTLYTHAATREGTQAIADDLFSVVASGAVKIRIDQRYPLAEAAQAQRELEARKTTGSSVLLV
jgi:NADPH2:quinone reductase